MGEIDKEKKELYNKEIKLTDKYKENKKNMKR